MDKVMELVDFCIFCAQRGTIFRNIESANDNYAVYLSHFGPDFRFENHGSVVMVRPLTKDAKRFTQECISTEGWQWMGGAFAADPRMAQHLAEGLQSDGYTVTLL